MWEPGYNNGKVSVACGECTTIAEIHGVGIFVKVDTKRYLDRGDSATDPNRRAQYRVPGATTVTEKFI